MAKVKNRVTGRAEPTDEIPPGATRKAFNREDLGGGPPGSPLGDRHAQGTPAGGTEVGGLGGSNIGDGSPVEPAEEPRDEDAEAYGGFSGGAVGGTPAGLRSRGGRTHGGIAPGGTHRGDSTIGSDPDKPAEAES